MIHFLHTFQPESILWSWGPIHLYWYGFFVVLGMAVALFITIKLSHYYGLATETVFDLSFWLIVGGLIGARLYDVGLNLSYYLNHPDKILAIWQGGLAIHGGIIAGLIVTWFFSRFQKINFWKLSALVVPGLALAQAIGRWGNYFNQEIFGYPTNQAWGIPIALANRPPIYQNYNFFQPTFLYESLGCFLIFGALLFFNHQVIKKRLLNKNFYVLSVSLYMILYSILRFCLEFIRIDTTPSVLGLRWPQIISLLIIAIALIVLKTQLSSKKQLS